MLKLSEGASDTGQLNTNSAWVPAFAGTMCGLAYLSMGPRFRRDDVRGLRSLSMVPAFAGTMCLGY